jgi:hypothetical protein
VKASTTAVMAVVSTGKALTNPGQCNQKIKKKSYYRMLQTGVIWHLE